MIWAAADTTSGPVTVTVASRVALLDDLCARLARGEGFAVATINLDHVVKLRRNRNFRMAYGAHSHVTADGRPIVWLSRLSGQKVDLVTGSDLVDPLVRLASAEGVSVAMVGSTEPVLAAAAAELGARHPGLEIALRLSPAMGFEPDGPEADTVIERIRASGAGLCLLAFGAPKQEILAARAMRALPGTGFVSIGAGLDFLAGTQKRAPRVVRAFAAEWLWRLMSDPRRLGRRYAACMAALPGLAGTALMCRFGSRGGRPG